jgi:hypothetical protein
LRTDLIDIGWEELRFPTLHFNGKWFPAHPVRESCANRALAQMETEVKEALGELLLPAPHL